MPRDYYEILGVPRSASDEDIRKAHRRLARKFHPDVNKSADAPAKFAESQEAYDVLSDAEKRKRYDQFGHAGVNGHASEGRAGGGSGGDPFSGAGGPFRGGPRPGQPGWTGSDAGGQWSDVDPETFDTIFGDLFGARGGARGGRAAGGGSRSSRPNPPAVGVDIDHPVGVPFAVAANGGSESVKVTLGDGSSQSIDVRIPAGIKHGSKLRVKGKGQAGRNGGPPGDLILTINVGDHPWFKRDGLDLSLDVPITIAEAALGTIIEVPLMKGTVKLKVPAGTSSGARLRAKGKGITDAKGDAGDFYAVMKVVAPESLTDEEKATLEAMHERLPNPRGLTLWGNDVGLA